MLNYEKSAKCKNRTNEDRISDQNMRRYDSYREQSADIVLEKKD